MHHFILQLHYDKLIYIYNRTSKGLPELFRTINQIFMSYFRSNSLQLSGIHVHHHPLTAMIIKLIRQVSNHLYLVQSFSVNNPIKYLLLFIKARNPLKSMKIAEKFDIQDTNTILETGDIQVEIQEIKVLNKQANKIIEQIFISVTALQYK